MVSSLRTVSTSPRFSQLITAAILVAGIAVGLETSPAVTDRIGGLSAPHGGVHFPAAGGLDRAALFENLHHLTGPAEICPDLSILRAPEGWQVAASGRRVFETDCLIVAAGALTPDFLPELAAVANR